MGVVCNSYDVRTSLFDYHLSSDFIAQKSVRPRDASRLLILDRKTGRVEHRIFRDIVEYLGPGDLLVMNNTKVFRARLMGTVNGSRVEILLIHPRIHALKHLPAGKAGESVWLALARPRKKLAIGSVVRFTKNMTATVEKKNPDGTVIVRCNRSVDQVVRIANEIGAVPVPPYIKQTPRSLDDYQTVYALKTGSVAAPTAGFHFTPRLLGQIRRRGVKIAFVTLHVGLGTFQPIRSSRLEDHPIHAEWAEVPSSTFAAVRSASRVIAVGTTTVRALEGLTGRSGWVKIFIKPGYHFKIIDGLITNFHLPRSTLLALVSAFAGHSRIMRTYQTAVRKKYRFYSFGDAMFIH